jgi:hypothetical protein
METGISLRVEHEGKIGNYDLAELPNEKIEAALKTRPKKEILRWVTALVERFRTLGSVDNIPGPSDYAYVVVQSSKPTTVDLFVALRGDETAGVEYFTDLADVSEVLRRLKIRRVRMNTVQPDLRARVNNVGDILADMGYWVEKD